MTFRHWQLCSALLVKPSYYVLSKHLLELAESSSFMSEQLLHEAFRSSSGSCYIFTLVLSRLSSSTSGRFCLFTRVCEVSQMVCNSGHSCLFAVTKKVYIPSSSLRLCQVSEVSFLPLFCVKMSGKLHSLLYPVTTHALHIYIACIPLGTSHAFWFSLYMMYGTTEAVDLSCVYLIETR